MPQPLSRSGESRSPPRPTSDRKLLDFGIAKLLEGSPEEATVTREQRLTFDAAAPEQIRGEPVSTATDIRSEAARLRHRQAAGRLARRSHRDPRAAPHFRCRSP